jgi:hypothetical protein
LAAEAIAKLADDLTPTLTYFLLGLAKGFGASADGFALGLDAFAEGLGAFTLGFGSARCCVMVWLL